MTNSKHLPSTRARRNADVEFTPRPRPTGAAQPSRKRAFASTISVLSIVALGGALAIPTATALSSSPPAASGGDSSLYDAAVADAQKLTVDDVVLVTAFERPGTNYEAYVTPTPTPEPEPEPESEPEVASAQDDSGAAEETSYAPPQYSGGGSKEDWMTAAGIASGDWAYVDYIVSRESGWNPNATNSNSGACGLIQVYPCGKIDNAYDPIVNLSWANSYATGRYGSWADAYAFWTNNHWW